MFNGKNCIDLILSDLGISHARKSLKVKKDRGTRDYLYTDVFKTYTRELQLNHSVRKDYDFENAVFVLYFVDII